jgi:MATE family, multidrug efflux pump
LPQTEVIVPPIRQEIHRLTVLAIPVVVTQLATMMLGVVDTIMVGHVGRQALAAAALGHVWTMGTMVFGMGLIIGIDPIVTQAHGARDGQRLTLILQRGLIVAAFASIPLALLWAYSGFFLRALGQPTELCDLAQSYTRAQIPGAPAYMIYTALRQYLQGRGIVRPTMILAVGANAFNALANWVLVFGHLGFAALGVTGAGYATGSTRVFMAIALVILIWRLRLTHEGWTGFSREAWRWRGLREVLSFGTPVGVQLSLEIWAFETATLLAGHMGELTIAAHTIVLNVASISFMVPLGISQAAVTRVGNLLGAGQPLLARRASRVALVMGASVMSVSAIAFVVARHAIGRLYTTDGEVIALAASVFPVAAAFQLFDGTQVVGAGVLRGMGSTRPAAVFNFVGFYLMALPLAWFLAFRQNLGLAGIWWGLALGLAVVATCLVAWILRKGPGMRSA